MSTSAAMHELMTDAPCGFVSFTDDGTVVEANQTLASMLGYSRIEITGWHIEKLLPPGGRIFYHTYLFPLLKVKRMVEEVYIALRAQDGTDIPVLLNGARSERGGRIVNDCVCLRMIQRHAYEDQLLQARKLAEEANAAKASFLSMMSHDLRTPLTTIQGNAQLLEAGTLGPLNEEQLQSMQAIREACRMQMALIGDILEFARLDSGHVSMKTGSVVVSESIARAEALVRVQAADAGLTLITRGCSGDAAAIADPDRLQQIVLNLLTNAIKFTPPGGEITVSCRTHHDRVHIEVRDTGIGIADADQERIFSPFVQVSDVIPRSAARRGIGLGLALSRDLARAMDGDIAVESEAGAGSVFTISLPAVHAVSVAGV